MKTDEMINISGILLQIIKYLPGAGLQKKIIEKEQNELFFLLLLIVNKEKKLAMWTFWHFNEDKFSEEKVNPFVKMIKI